MHAQLLTLSASLKALLHPNKSFMGSIVTLCNQDVTLESHPSWAGMERRLSTQSLMCVACSRGVTLASLAGSGSTAYSNFCSTLIVGVGGVLSMKTVRLLPCKVTGALLGKNA